MKRSETIGKLAEALAKAQGAMEAATKGADNPFFKSRYADLAAVFEAIRKPLADNGLAIVQGVHSDPERPGYTTLTTMLLHASGEWVETTISGKPVKDDPQGVGSWITYMRRYSLQAMVGLAADDDDGNAASGRDPRAAATAAKAKEVAAKPKRDRESGLEPPLPPHRIPEEGDDERGAHPHASTAELCRPQFFARARKLTLTDAQAGALAKATAAKASSNEFTDRDWALVFGQLDMRERWLGFAETRAVAPADAIGWAGEAGFAWTAPWDPERFEAHLATKTKAPAPEGPGLGL